MFFHVFQYACTCATKCIRRFVLYRCPIGQLRPLITPVFCLLHNLHLCPSLIQRYVVELQPHSCVETMLPCSERRSMCLARCLHKMDLRASFLWCCSNLYITSTFR